MMKNIGNLNMTENIVNTVIQMKFDIDVKSTDGMKTKY